MAATNGTAVGGSPEVSVRVAQTDPPCIVKTKALVAGTPGALSLSQGTVGSTYPASKDIGVTDIGLGRWRPLRNTASIQHLRQGCFCSLPC